MKASKNLNFLLLFMVGGLHDPKTGRRLTQKAKRGDFKVLTRVAFRTSFIPSPKGKGLLGGVR